MSASAANHVQTEGFDTQYRERALRLAASTIAFLAFCLLTISLRPFSSGSLIVPDDGVPGDSLNQIGFVIAGITMAGALATLVDRRLLRIFLSPTWLAIGFVLAVAIVMAPDPSSAMRSVTLTMIGMMIAAGIILLPPDEEAFQRVTAAAILSVLALSYSGVILFPDLAIHGMDAHEPQHQGLWRGHFSHKNIAGPVTSVFVMFGIYLWRSGMRGVGALIAVLALIFVIQTGSKTTNGLLPIAVLIVLAGRVFGLPLLTIGLYALAVALVTGLTIGSIYSETWAGFTKAILDDPTFTGRVTLWEYGIRNVSEYYWFGTGFDSFWATSKVRNIEYPFEWAWDFRNIVHGHSNFVDMALTTGIVGFGVLLWVLFIAPAFNYVKACRIPGNSRIADLFMMILVFMTMLSFLETFFLRRVDPIWLMMFMSVTGLQLAARFRAAKT